MYLLTVKLYEFGQFLRILLWIFIPMVIIASLITTYMHYRNKRQRIELDGQVILPEYHEGTAPEDGESLVIPALNGQAAQFESTGAYQGMLWIKEKYEQYRESTDKKYERLKNELDRSEKKYLDLLASRSESQQSALPGVQPVHSVHSGAQSVHSDCPPVHSDAQSSLSGAQPVIPEAQPIPEGTKEEKQEPAIEKNSLLDLVEEKNSQINFLQSQLEQRIRNYHRIEYQRREERRHLTELQGQYLEAQQALETQQQLLRDSLQSLNEKQQLLEECQRTVQHKEQLLDESQQALRKNEQDLRKSQADIEQLNEQLQQETRRTMDLSGKLECNSLLLLHIYKELDRSLNVEKGLPDTEELKILNGLTDPHHLPVNEVALI
jgi:DNA repair exonuclease SbcCD ATPase subunit